MHAARLGRRAEPEARIRLPRTRNVRNVECATYDNDLNELAKAIPPGVGLWHEKFVFDRRRQANAACRCCVRPAAWIAAVGELEPLLAASLRNACSA